MKRIGDKRVRAGRAKPAIRLRRMRTNLTSGASLLAKCRRIGTRLLRKGGSAVYSGLLIKANAKKGVVDVLDLPHMLTFLGINTWPDMVDSPILTRKSLLSYRIVQKLIPTRAAVAVPEAITEVPGSFYVGTSYSEFQPAPEETREVLGRLERPTFPAKFYIFGHPLHQSVREDFYQCPSYGWGVRARFMLGRPGVPYGGDPGFDVQDTVPLPHGPVSRYFGVEVDLVGVARQIIRISVSEAYIRQMSGWGLYPDNYYTTEALRETSLLARLPTAEWPVPIVDFDGSQICIVVPVTRGGTGPKNVGKRALLVMWHDITSTGVLSTDENGETKDFEFAVIEYPTATAPQLTQGKYTDGGWRPTYTLGSVVITGNREAVMYASHITYSHGIHDVPDGLSDFYIDTRPTALCTTFKLDISPSGGAFHVIQSVRAHMERQQFNSSILVNAPYRTGPRAYEVVRQVVAAASVDDDGEVVTWCIREHRNVEPTHHVPSHLVTSYSPYRVTPLNAHYFSGHDSNDPEAYKSWFSVIKGNNIVYNTPVDGFFAYANTMGLDSPFAVALPVFGGMEMGRTIDGCIFWTPRSAVCHLNDRGEFGATFVLFNVYTKRIALAKWDSIDGFTMANVDLSGISAPPVYSTRDFVNNHIVSLSCIRKQKISEDSAGNRVVVGEPVYILSVQSFDVASWLIAGDTVKRIGPISGSLVLPTGNSLTVGGSLYSIYED